MRTFLLVSGFIAFSFGQVAAQRACHSSEYLQDQLKTNSALGGQLNQIETFVQQQLAAANTSRLTGIKIIIPVVVHILYHYSYENIADAQVNAQIDMLNKCYGRTNSDTANTPDRFKPLAADCEIEFRLAISDPQRRSTTGIIHKYTPIISWNPDDQMKNASQMGDDAWDSRNYLNIWVCNMHKLAGYSSVPGDDPVKDGIVIDFSVFGLPVNPVPGYEQGRTAVHEIGHWLGLKHIWGDSDCGDDFVDDTPKQKGYNIGCPTGIRVTCSNGPNGDMYMNFMDYTHDECVNLFTEGQKERIRAFFSPGGPRSSLLTSFGLSAPLTNESQLPDDPPNWLFPRIFPNPANDELFLDIAYDIRWVGKVVSIFNANGERVLQLPITSRKQKIDVSRLQAGLYIISGQKEDGSYIKQKFIKI